MVRNARVTTMLLIMYAMRRPRVLTENGCVTSTTYTFLIQTHLLVRACVGTAIHRSNIILIQSIKLNLVLNALINSVIRSYMGPGSNSQLLILIVKTRVLEHLYN